MWHDNRTNDWKYITFYKKICSRARIMKKMCIFAKILPHTSDEEY